MHEVKRTERDIDGTGVVTWKRNIHICGVCSIEVEAGTNAHVKRSTKHEASYIRIKPETEGFYLWTEDKDFKTDTTPINDVVLILDGGYERMAVIDGLKFILQVLEEEGRED